jgi:hypothetical protein
MFCFKNSIPLIVPNTDYADSKALKLQSVSPIYDAQEGGLDVADARGGAQDPGFATTQSRMLITRVKQLKEEHRGEVGLHRSGNP